MNEEQNTREDALETGKGGRRKPAASSAVLEPSKSYGAGYLYHYNADYQDFAHKLAAVGGTVDIYEILGIQFNSEPESAARFAKHLAKPITLHSFEYCLGNVERPPQAVRDRIQSIAELADVEYIGEHLGFMGTTDTYIGGFMQPPGTQEQTDVVINNLKHTLEESSVPIIVENPSQFYEQTGLVSIGRQLRELSEETGAGILLSLSNISISERFRPQDRDAFLAEIPLSRVRELHVLCGNTAEERMPGMEETRYEHEWALKTLKELASEKDLQPASVVFELETGTPSFPDPEKLRDYMEMARDLFFRN